MNCEHILSDLNDEQRKAVSSELTNLLVIAGAGTGKTKVLTHRIAYLIKHHQINSNNILAVTFTNKAAQEMRNRLESLLNYEDIKYITCSTFHSTCLLILRRFFKEANLNSNFSIIDTSIQQKIINEILKSLGIKETSKAKQYLNQISALKEKCKRPSDCWENESNLEKFSDVYTLYQDRCEKLGVVDFSEILLRTYELLKDNLEVRKFYNLKYKQILVDEFQDTNELQYKWLRLLAGNETNVLVVGDDDKSIYGWRGAVIDNMFRFTKDFSNVKQVQLLKNYRSINSVLKTANSLIKNNQNRFVNKELKSAYENSDKKVIVIESDTAIEEAKLITKLVSLMQSKVAKQHFENDEIAILYRTNAQSKLIEQELVKKGIDFHVYGGLRYFDREEVKDVLSYIKLCINTSDDLSLERIINVPSRKIGKTTISKIKNISKEQDCSMYDACRIYGKESKSVAKFVATIDRFISLLEESKENLKVVDYLEKLVLDTGILSYYESRDEAEDKDSSSSRVRNIYELIASFNEDYKDQEINNGYKLRDIITTYLNNIMLLTPLDTKDSEVTNKVRLMTIHSAKGLEFPCVIIAGFENELLPLENTFLTKEHIEEERRLAYVAITRAKRELIITYSNSRFDYKTGGFSYKGKSFFIDELDKDFVSFKKFVPSDE